MSVDRYISGQPYCSDNPVVSPKQSALVVWKLFGSGIININIYLQTLASFKKHCNALS
jgi:hypothetical protein